MVGEMIGWETSHRHDVRDPEVADPKAECGADGGELAVPAEVLAELGGDLAPCDRRHLERQRMSRGDDQGATNPS